MIPYISPALLKAGAVLALLAALAGWHVHSVPAARAAGVSSESARRDGIDAINSARAKDELADMNAQVLDATRSLIAAQQKNQQLQMENDHEKLVSAQRQSDLLAGRERLRILTTTARQPDQAGQIAGAAAGAVDKGAEAYADIAPAAGAWIDGVRERHNEAVRRLDACIASYDAVKAASDSLGP